MENNFNQNTPVPEKPTQDTCQDASQETTAQAAPETAPKPPVKGRRGDNAEEDGNAVILDLYIGACGVNPGSWICR